ncbi:MAG TPA: TIGR02300 family protein [Holophagaceae bacterium]|nr:TIGR02300 family protein [Holophagaceae bacterium]
MPADLGKKYICFNCGTKFYDFKKPEAVCPKCNANQKSAPAKVKAPKKEKSVHVIEDDEAAEPEHAESVDEFSADAVGLDHRREGIDPGDLRMDDYDE